MNILHLVSSFRGDESLSFQLGNAIIDKLVAQNPTAEVTTNNLAKNPIPHLNEVHITSFFTPDENHTPELKEAIQHSNTSIAQLQDADVLVIDVPMYNFTIPSTLKSWIDHIARAGITFRYTENGPEGLMKNKKAYLAIATGGVYSLPAYQAADFTENYLRAILQFIGIEDVTVYRVEGLAVPELKENALQKALEELEEAVLG